MSRIIETLRLWLVKVWLDNTTRPPVADDPCLILYELDDEKERNAPHS